MVQKFVSKYCRCQHAGGTVVEKGLGPPTFFLVVSRVRLRLTLRIAT